MPRRQFVADLVKARSGVLPNGISRIKTGEDDGQIEILYDYPMDQSMVDPIRVTAMVPDISEYPDCHSYIIFSDDSAPRHVAAALTKVSGINRKTIPQLLEVISTTLTRALQTEDEDSQMPDSCDFEEQDELGSEPDIYDSDHEAFADTTRTYPSTFTDTTPTFNTTAANESFRTRLRADLRAAKEAGFRVAGLGRLLDGDNAFLTISVRMSKLGISEEAMQAWQVNPLDYLMLIFHYPNGYKHNEQLQSCNSMRPSTDLRMTVVASKKYKPTLQEAIKASSTSANKSQIVPESRNNPGPTRNHADDCNIRSTFISKSLEGLLNDCLVHILRYRSAGMDWLGAEKGYHAQPSNGRINPPDDALFNKSEQVNKSFPNIVRADHYDTGASFKLSFPLLAMQFLLRHFVRCTEFCLVCHQKLNTDVEAIKPYVCDRGLCLYQYMALGFGPSLEHEIISQPYVVDLLISFCYKSAANHKLAHFPDGLSLTVPVVEHPKIDSLAIQRSSRHKSKESESCIQPIDRFDVEYDARKFEVMFRNQSAKCPVKTGNWLVLTISSDEDIELHCRVKDTTYYPTISVNEPIKVPIDPGSICAIGNFGSGIESPANIEMARLDEEIPKWVSASFHVYIQDFSTLDQKAKCRAIRKLLDTLPSVTQMRDYLTDHPSNELLNWRKRISPSALSVLRWIIASNRACIMQVDSDGFSSNKTSDPLSTRPFTPVQNKVKDRVSGMKGFMQFRFAMGAPDKEQRFLKEVRKTTARLNLEHPTIFAWHGSPLWNWHMIIREGLHYKNRDHGRAYGDGVYHAKDSATSSGYSGGGSGDSLSWPHSALRISSALALNEIVNAPREFQSKEPYYVVQHLDWIQTRFLFVNCAPTTADFLLDIDEKPLHEHPQDPKATPKGVSGEIAIPASAIQSRRGSAHKRTQHNFDPNPNPFKKLKRSSTASTPVRIDHERDDDTDSVATDAEDMQLLVDESVSVKSSTTMDPSTDAKQEIQASRLGDTDFEAGTLDFRTLPIMPLPTYASLVTTKCLMKELQSLHKVQSKTPAVELGWYIDIEKIENAYQWIVELHSFHTFENNGKRLPLADDMKKKKIKSIVLEVRFNKDFPYTPPYVRVVRPRFLTLSQGGGGHVVMGGAMCMELLTNTGWSSVSTMESVLMQIRMAIASEPFARLDMHGKGDYGTGEAANGYIRAAKGHGWQIPPGFEAMAHGTQRLHDGLVDLT